MGNALLSSKVVTLEESPKVRAIDAVQTSVVAAVGVTERGPLGVPTLVTSFDEFTRVFGGFTADSDVALAAQGFFENGGQFLYVVRTVHYTDPAVASSKTSAAGTLTLQTPTTSATAGQVTGTVVEPFDLEPGDDLDVVVDGGGPLTATFTATRGQVSSGNTDPFALVDGDVLNVEIDGGAPQAIAFLTAEFATIGAASAEEVAAVINAKLSGGFADVVGGNTVRINSDRRGTGSSVEVTGGTANAVGKLNFPTAIQNGTGNVADIDAVTVAEVKTVVEAAVTGVTVSSVGGVVRIVSNTTGPTSSVQVQASSTADDELGLDNAVHAGTDGSAVNTLQVDGKTDGSYANGLQIRVAVSTSGEADRFNLVVLEDGLIVETFPNLSMVDTDSRFAESVINEGAEESDLIVVVDLDATVESQRPADGTFGPLTGGDDGLAGIVDADFTGSSVGQTGIRALDTIQDVNILIVPGQATSAVQNAMVTYVEDTRSGSMVAVLDPPAAQSAIGIVTYVETTAGLLGLSEYAAMYWPRVKIQNPSTAVFGSVAQIEVAPSGIVAGVYARTDASRPGGVYVPPAGIENGILRGVLGFETDEVFDEAKRDIVYPKRINILTSFPGAPRHIDGARTLKSNGNFPYVSQRRGAIFIEQSIKNGVEFARNQNNTPKLRRVVERSIFAFLLGQLRVEAFASQDPDTAFFVDFSEKLNSPSEVSAGRMNGRVGLAFNTPAEWIVIRFSRDTRALDQELAG
jgi:phage tail sheath protein FI